MWAQKALAPPLPVWEAFFEICESGIVLLDPFSNNGNKGLKGCSP